MNRTLPILAIAVAAVFLFPESAQACAVCFDMKAETRWAFVATTVFLSLLPLGMIGGGIYWLWRRARMLAEEEGTLEPPIASGR